MTMTDNTVPEWSISSSLGEAVADLYSDNPYICIMETRQCAKCKTIKSLIDFPNKKGSHLNKAYRCKECNRIDYRERRMKNIATHKKKDRNYYKRHKKEIKNKRRIYAFKNKNKIRARYLVQSAILKGTLIRPAWCENCKIKCIPDAHHRDYTKPLQVVWLCRKCHQIEHNGK